MRMRVPRTICHPRSAAMILTRRSFLHEAAVAIAAGNLAQAAEPKGADVFPVIDTHQHLWDLSKFRLPWLQREPALAKSYVMEDYIRATSKIAAPAKVVKT